MLRCRVLGHRFRFTSDGPTMRSAPALVAEDGGIELELVRAALPVAA